MQESNRYRNTTQRHWFGTDMGDERAEIAIIGGTGMYDAKMLTDAKQVTVDTKYGAPSDEITVGTFMGRQTAFLPRHGRGHTIAPHLINYRANIDALKQLGVRRIIAPSAVGSLQAEIAPEDFALPSQFIDLTKSRQGSFSDGGKIIHISVADPFCPEICRCATDAAHNQGTKMHKDCTYVCIEGPRFSTRAESKLFREWGAHIIGMTLVPECQLAREAEICYTSVSMVTDYDVWADKPVSAREVRRIVSSNAESMRKMLADIVQGVPKSAGCSCQSALDDSEI